jgi:hypothetical protein
MIGDEAEAGRQPPGTGKTLPCGWEFVKKFRRTRLDMPPLLAAVRRRQGFHFDRGTTYIPAAAVREVKKKEDNVQDFGEELF